MPIPQILGKDRHYGGREPDEDRSGGTPATRSRERHVSSAPEGSWVGSMTATVDHRICWSVRVIPPRRTLVSWGRRGKLTGVSIEHEQQRPAAPRYRLAFGALIENRLTVNVSGRPPVEQISKP